MKLEVIFGYGLLYPYFFRRLGVGGCVGSVEKTRFKLTSAVSVRKVRSGGTHCSRLVPLGRGKCHANLGLHYKVVEYVNLFQAGWAAVLQGYTFF